MSDKLLALLLISLLVTLPHRGIALPGDNQQPINVKAERATQRTLDGGEKTEYFGNVVMTQGSLLLNAEHVVIHSVNRKVTQIVATGGPARLQQQSNPDNPPVKARANTIDYQLNTEMVTLTDDAHIDQPDASFSGNHLKYNVATEEVIAEDGVDMVFTPAEEPAPDTDESAPAAEQTAPATAPSEPAANATKTQEGNGKTTGP